MVRSAFDLAVVRADHGALLHVRTHDVGRGAMRIDVVRAILAIVLGDDDQRVFGVGALRHGLTSRPTARSSSACCVSGVFTPPSAEPKLPMVSWLTRMSERLGRLPLATLLVELALPLVVAPQIGIALIVAAEVDVGHRRERRVERRDLHHASGERIADRRRLRSMLPMLFTRKP